MDLALPPDHQLADRTAKTQCDNSKVGASSGVNISPGSDDDGWTVPQPVTLDDGTRVQLYKDGEALHAGFRAIQQAKRRICLEFYIFASDETGRAFAELLCKKASEGVKVYLIYDSFGSLGSDREMFMQMKRAGVHVKQFHPWRPWESHFGYRPFNRDHRKLLLIDDDIAGMGGLNVGHEYAGSWVGAGSRRPEDCDFWRDNAIGLQGPSARHFHQAFAKTWHYIHHGGRIRTTEFMYNLESLDDSCERNELSILASTPTRSSSLRGILHTMFRGATTSLQMTMAYFAPDDDLIDQLCRAAKRGVRVQLMLPARTDVHLLTIAARSFYEKLMNNGVEVYERQSVVLHAKTMTIDGCLTVIGSTNLDYRSIEYNLELSAIVRSRQFGKQMHDLFANDMRYAKRISLKEWRRRPTSDRVIQWAVSRARYLL